MPVVDLGKHIILNFYGCEPEKLNDIDLIRSAVDEAITEMKVEKIGEMEYHFDPVGLTYVVGIKESHVSIHTWPETGEATIDIYTCGKESPRKGFLILKNLLKPKYIDIIYIDRREMKIIQKARIPSS